MLPYCDNNYGGAQLIVDHGARSAIQEYIYWIRCSLTGEITTWFCYSERDEVFLYD